MIANSVNSVARVTLPDQIRELKKTQSDEFGLFEVMINTNTDEILKSTRNWKNALNQTAITFSHEIEKVKNEIETKIAISESEQNHHLNKIVNSTVSDWKNGQSKANSDVTQISLTLQELENRFKLQTDNLEVLRKEAGKSKSNHFELSMLLATQKSDLRNSMNAIEQKFEVLDAVQQNMLDTVESLSTKISNEKKEQKIFINQTVTGSEFKIG